MPKLQPPDHVNRSLFVMLQHLLPHHLISRVVWLATRAQAPWWKNFLIRSFLRHYPVRMEEAVQPDASAYASFNDFFTRAQRPEARPVDSRPDSIVSPVDGTVSEAGQMEGERLLQAKGRDYTLTELLGGDEALARHFTGGAFATLYLAPHNYHRIHMPATGRLISTLYVPGRLFSVNGATAQRVPRLFARNERVVCVFEGEAGLFAVILVGALNVGSMATVWAGDITPARRRKITRLPSPPTPLELEKGAELGRFNMGSTVILLFEPGKVRWHPRVKTGAGMRMGEAIDTPE
jgi:phosphatidylserine decarboxylase